jgi:hypothetical protein
LAVDNDRIQIENQVAIRRNPHGQFDARTARNSDAAIIAADILANNAGVNSAIGAPRVDVGVSSYGDYGPGFDSSDGT